MLQYVKLGMTKAKSNTIEFVSRDILRASRYVSNKMQVLLGQNDIRWSPGRVVNASDKLSKDR